MPRIVYIGMFLAVALVPFLFFAALSAGGSRYDDGNYYGSSYRRGPSFLFLDIDFDRKYRRRGRGYSRSGFQGGGSRFGK